MKIANAENIFSSLPKESIGLVLIAFGLLMMMGAIRRWRWVLDMTGQRSRSPFGFLTLLQDWFGENGVRIGIIIISVLIILCGVVLLVLMR